MKDNSKQKYISCYTFLSFILLIYNNHFFKLFEGTKKFGNHYLTQACKNTTRGPIVAHEKLNIMHIWVEFDGNTLNNLYKHNQSGLQIFQ